MNAQLAVFLLLALVGVLAAAMMVTRRNPVHSALYLIVTFFSVAAVYVVLHAEVLDSARQQIGPESVHRHLQHEASFPPACLGIRHRRRCR